MQRAAGMRPEVSPCKAGSLAPCWRSPPHFILDHEGLSHTHGLKPCICVFLAALGTGTTEQVRVFERHLENCVAMAGGEGGGRLQWGQPAQYGVPFSSSSTLITFHTVMGKAAGRPTLVTSKYVNWGCTVVPVEGSLWATQTCMYPFDFQKKLFRAY